MTTRYYELTECKHGKFEPHNISDAESGRLVEWEGPYRCPGGLRRELTGVEVVEMRTQRADNLAPGIYGLPAGRHLIIPLDEPDS